MKKITCYGALSLLDDVASVYSGKNILLVTGKHSFEISGAKKIIFDKLQHEKVFKFSDFSVNPKLKEAIQGVKFARKNNIEVIIAIGGGSVLDTAKLIKAFYGSSGHEESLVIGKSVLIDPLIPIIAIPTTAGSGSEATHYAVVYIGSEKYSLASKYLLPDVVILDGSLSTSSDRYLKICNALDAMAQAIESFWAVGANKKSQKHSLAAIELGWKTLHKFVSQNCSESDAQNMIESSNFAGMAINISKTTAAHAWSYTFTSNYNIPHGHAVWLTLPAIFDIHFRESQLTHHKTANQKKFSIDMQTLCSKLNLDTSKIEDQLTNFLSNIGLEYQMERLGLDTKEKRKLAANQVNIERLKNNPINLDAHKKKIFRY
jgi:alcohol dehydrogenase